MKNELVYREMTVSEGVAHIEQHYTTDELKKITCFSDLHELRDANMTLPFIDDCGKSEWLEFANAVIETFDLKMQKTGDNPMVKKGDVVKFKPQWQDKGDDKIEFRAVDDEYDGRVEVVACIDLPLKPTQIVPVKWLDIPGEKTP